MKWFSYKLLSFMEQDLQGYQISAGVQTLTI